MPSKRKTPSTSDYDAQSNFSRFMAAGRDSLDHCPGTDGDKDGPGRIDYGQTKAEIRRLRAAGYSDLFRTRNASGEVVDQPPVSQVETLGKLRRVAHRIQKQQRRMEQLEARSLDAGGRSIPVSFLPFLAQAKAGQRLKLLERILAGTMSKAALKDAIGLEHEGRGRTFRVHGPREARLRVRRECIRFVRLATAAKGPLQKDVEAKALLDAATDIVQRLKRAVE